MQYPLRKLIVHIGDIKSATTAVQVALASGRQPVTTDVLMYPVRGLNHNYIKKHFKDPTNLLGSHHPDIQWLRNKMQSGIEGQLCIISAEQLAGMRPKKLKKAINSAFGDLAEDITILHYVRPHIDRILSAYAEQIKTGITKEPLEGFLRNVVDSKLFMQHNRLSRLRAAFGDNYHLRPMLPETLLRKDAVVDFFDAVLGYVPKNWKPPSLVNESLSATGLSQVAKFQSNLTNEIPLLRHALGYEFARLYMLDSDATKKGKLGMSQDTVAELQDLFLADAEAVDSEMFGGARLFTPALKEGTERALLGEAKPLDIPQDVAGARITDRLLEGLNNSGNKQQLGVQMRNARYKRYIEEARGLLHK